LAAVLLRQSAKIGLGLSLCGLRDGADGETQRGNKTDDKMRNARFHHLILLTMSKSPEIKMRG
jgi:hypothetical protein